MQNLDDKEDLANFVKASTLFNEKKYEQALKALQMINTKDFKFLMLRSQLYYSQNEFYLSNKDAENAISLQPKNLKPYQLCVLNQIAMLNIQKAEDLIKESEEKTVHNKEDNNEIKKLISQQKNQLNDQTKKYAIFPKYLAFMHYLYEQGAYINKVDISFNNEANRGVFSTDVIKKKEIILRIPLNALITLEIAQDSPSGKYLTQEVKAKLHSPNHCLLTAYLLDEMEKGENSKWKFYFDMLPDNYDSFPIFYTEKEEKLLKGTVFLQRIIQKKKEMNQDYIILCSVIKDFIRFSYVNFCKARMIVSSRMFGVKINNKKTDALVPYADMLNHKKPRQTNWNYEDIHQAFIVQAFENIPAGCEVFDSYGKKCNSRFLLNYGFTIENNDTNEIRIEVILVDDGSELFKQKNAILKSNTSRKFNLKRDLEDTQTGLLFSFLRFIVLNENELNDFKNYKAESKLGPVSIVNELMALEKLKKIMYVLLSNYGSTLQENVDYLNKNRNQMTFNEFNCYVMKISEMEIIQYYFDLATYCPKLFNKDKMEEIFKEERKNDDSEIYCTYIKEVYNALFKGK